MDFRNVLLNRTTEALWVCNNCFYRFKRKYKFTLNRGATPKVDNNERLDAQRKVDGE